MNRRNWFQLAAGAAALRHAFAAPASVADRPAAEVAKDEDFWSAVRNEFTTDRTVVNLNNGHVSPAPRTVQEAMRRYLDYSNLGPYHTMIRELDPRVASARRMVAEQAGVGEDEIALTRNSSEALEIAQLGLNLKAGDEVLTTNQDYPRMLTTYQQRERGSKAMRHIRSALSVASRTSHSSRHQLASFHHCPLTRHGPAISRTA